MHESGTVVNPTMTDEQWDKLRSHATPHDAEVGEFLVRAGQEGPALVVVESALVEVVREKLKWIDEEIIGTSGPRTFIGELGALNGQRPFLSLRGAEAGLVHLVSRADLRALMDEDDELCDPLLHALWARREGLRNSTAAMTLKLMGGGDLIGQTTLQALKFGVRVDAPRAAVSLQQSGDNLDITLADGRIICARSAIVTSGAAYRRLQLDRWDEFERAGIDYAATPLELRQVAGDPVVVVGGANSAGQAALYLAASDCPVDLVVRGDDLGTRMSSYLVGRLTEDPRVRVRTASNVVSLGGERSLASVGIDTVGSVDARGLFCFIGAQPATDWIAQLDRDAEGFIRTSSDVQVQTLAHWQHVGREPLPFETSTPRVFAAGDVHRGSMKRVAAAVGEGSSAVASVHRALALV